MRRLQSYRGKKYVDCIKNILISVMGTLESTANFLTGDRIGFPKEVLKINESMPRKEGEPCFFFFFFGGGWGHWDLNSGLY
jgi:hypothetical protein